MDTAAAAFHIEHLGTINIINFSDRGNACTLTEGVTFVRHRPFDLLELTAVQS